MDDISLDSVTYGTTGWNALVQANFEKITDYINNKLNPDLILTFDGEVLTFDGNVLVMEGT